MMCLHTVEINLSFKFNIFGGMFTLLGIIQNYARGRNVQENIVQNPVINNLIELLLLYFH